MTFSFSLRHIISGVLAGCLLAGNTASYGQVHKQAVAVKSDREYWLEQLDKTARPVLSNLAADKLKKAMPVGLSKRIDNAASRSKVAYLEAFGRLMSGIAPWLNLEGGSPKEVTMRNQYRQ